MAIISLGFGIVRADVNDVIGVYGSAEWAKEVASREFIQGNYPVEVWRLEQIEMLKGERIFNCDWGVEKQAIPLDERKAEMQRYLLRYQQRGVTVGRKR